MSEVNLNASIILYLLIGGSFWGLFVNWKKILEILTKKLVTTTRAVLCPIFFFYIYIHINDIHHPSWWINGSITWTSQATEPTQPIARRSAAPPPPRGQIPRVPTSVVSCAPVLFFQAARIHTLRPSQRDFDLADRRRECPSFFVQTKLAILLQMNSVILLLWTKSFLLHLLSYFCDLLQWLCHFVILSAILLFWTQPFFVECSDKPFFYNTKSFLQSCHLFLQWVSG
jgi:hypothetical protein